MQRTRALVLAVLASVALGACGSDTYEGNGVKNLPAPAEKAGSEKPGSGKDATSEKAKDSAKPSSTKSLSDAERVSAAAVATAKTDSSRIEMTMEMMGQEITIDGVIANGDEPRGTMTFDYGGLLPDAGAMEIRFVGDRVFMSVGAFASMGQAMPVPDGIEWIGIDGDDVGVSSTEMVSSQTSFTDTYQLLVGVSDSVESIEVGKVRGVTATHYRAELNPKKALDSVPEAQRDRVKKAAAMFGDKTLPIDVWVDADERIVRMEFTVDGDDIGQAAAGKVEMTMDLYDYGVEVDVEEPPADQVMTFAEFMQSALGEGYRSW